MRIDLENDFGRARAQMAAAIAALPMGEALSGAGFSDAAPQTKLAVLEAIPLSELKIEAAGWSWEKRLPPRGEWRVLLGETASDFVLCIPVVNRLDLLEKAVCSVRGLMPHVVIVDQTADGLDDRWEGRVAIYRWRRRPLHFSEMMNWCQRLAMVRGCALLGYMHNDAECAPGVAEGVLDECRHANYRGLPWGAAMTNYDSYCWFNMTAVRDVGCWDEAFQWYVADVDYYERLRAAGWQHLQMPHATVAHHASRTVRAMSDKEREHVRERHAAAARTYELKWGSPPNQRGRRYAVPYDGKPPAAELDVPPKGRIGGARKKRKVRPFPGCC
jgi:hypothetical protein